jgi:hypothetical protein
MNWDQAIEALFRAPHANFVAERKRLGGELKAAGDKDAAAKLMKLGRPPASAWAVNQTYWRAREAFDAFLETARRIRAGDIKALPDHKAAIAALRTHAGAFLREIGNAAQDATLRRVEITLSAIAATGSFDPDPSGALSDDRDPPGFLSLGIAGGQPPPPSAPLAPVLQMPPRPPAPPEPADAPPAPTEEEVRAAAVAERERRERDQRAREQRAAELALAKEAVSAAEAEVSRLEAELTAARKQLVVARTAVAEFERDA